MPDFSVDSPTPVYVRVADWIESRIKSGELKPGSRLPPERELARDCGVAYDTVRRAAVLLRERGLIHHIAISTHHRENALHRSCRFRRRRGPSTSWLLRSG